MPGMVSLTTGAIERIINEQTVCDPVLQILGIKKIPGTEMDRYRVLLSDGQYFHSYAMLANQLNCMCENKELQENTVIRVDNYITSVVNKTSDTGRRVLIILALTVLNPGSEVGQKIGNPVALMESARKTAPAPAAAPAVENKSAGSSGTRAPAANLTLNQSLNTGLTCPIASLSPYQNKWVIKARVTSKAPIRTWSNAKGEGKLFSMDLMDESGEIRATAFRDQCDKFYDMIEVDHVYFISKGQLKPANKQYSSLNNDYEMTFTSETMVQPCEEDESGIPEIRYNLVPISEIVNREPKSIVDTIGICKDAGELQTFTSRDGSKEFKKRELTLVDTSNSAVILTLWGDEAVNFDGHVQPVILIKGGRIAEFNGGKSISTGNSSLMKINPDIPEGHKLRGWFDNGGGENITNLVSARIGPGGSFNTDWLTFNEVRDRKLGTGDRADFFQCKAMVHSIKSQNAFYKACPQTDCNKKVIDEGNGHYRCERCNAVFPNFKYRLLINMSIGDWTSNRWVTCFNEVGEELLKRSAQEIGEMLEQDSPECEEIFKSLYFHSFVFKLRTKVELFGDISRNKMTVQTVSPVNYKEYNKYLIGSLKELTGIDKN